ncbi:uncharacterized protein LOC141618200 [Silene latifolia]|uniref:uncharacterized protein LOC141618200 n=1 Tax=Silene latifolia TaxID=37657 RepID=UPI003D77691A
MKPKEASGLVLDLMLSLSVYLLVKTSLSSKSCNAKIAFGSCVLFMVNQSLISEKLFGIISLNGSALLNTVFLLIGDFNQVDYQEDKWGGSKGRIPGASYFNKWKAEHFFMEDHSIVLERLDKGYGSWDWNDIFPNSGITHLPIQVSDHAPIIFEIDLLTYNGRRPYRIEAWNLDFEECICLVHNEWFVHVPCSITVRMIRKLSRARNCMRLWSISKRKEWNKKWSDFDDTLERGLHEIETLVVTRTFTIAYASHVEYAKISAKYWKQRAKIKWNIEGDTCSKYFFNWVKGRAGRNYIVGIKMDNGE